MSEFREGLGGLSIGVISGGDTPENLPWDPILDSVMSRNRVLIDGGHNVPTLLNVNIEFQVPGKFVQPDFLGVRTGYFRKSDRLLKVQVALPEAPPDEAFALLRSLVDRGLNLVADWAIRTKRPHEIDYLRSVVAQLFEGVGVASEKSD